MNNIIFTLIPKAALLQFSDIDIRKGDDAYFILIMYLTICIISIKLRAFLTEWFELASHLQSVQVQSLPF
jgi:hypothetical protein